MMADFLHVEGLDALTYALKELPGRIGKNVLRGMVSAGAAVVRDAAKANAPIYTGDTQKGHPPPGTLKRSIYQKQIRELSDGGRQVFYVGVRHGKKFRGQGKNKDLSQDAYYWWFVENGTVNMKRQSFLRPAFDNNKERAVDRMGEYGSLRLPAEVEKLRNGG
jgi:HK97 gp10 family phage protein